MIVRALSNVAGVEVEGVDLGRPQTPAESRTLAELYDEHGLVVFRDQRLTREQVVQAVQPFGGPMIDVPGAVTNGETPGLLMVSTRGADGAVMPEDPDALVGDIEWHMDQGYVTAPSRGKMLYSVEVPPEGGRTGFVDGQAIYRALPEDMRRRVDGLHVIHSWSHAEDYIARGRRYAADGDKQMAKNRYPDIAFPLVLRHPITGVKSLNAPPLWAAGIVELPGGEGRAFLDELIAYIRNPQNQYWHSYRVGDAILWDNWRMIHSAGGTPGRHARTLWGVSLKGGTEIGVPMAA